MAKGIKIQYEDFELEDSADCNADRITTVASRPFGKTRECGGRVQLRELMGNAVMVEFISNDVVDKKGFKAGYTPLFMDKDSVKVKSTIQSSRLEATSTPGTILFAYS